MVIKEKFNPDKVFFTSDLHLKHENIIKFCHRPYATIEEHDEAIIQNWNDIVTPDSDIFMLGDFIWTAHIPTVTYLLNKLNGRIWWVMGNHDYQNRLHRDEISKVVEGRQYDIIRTIIDDKQFTMCHFPMMFWDRNAYMLYGHVHGGDNSTANEQVSPHPKMYDVGVDNNNYTPISFHDLMKHFNTQNGI